VSKKAAHAHRDPSRKLSGAYKAYSNFAEWRVNDVHYARGSHESAHVAIAQLRPSCQKMSTTYVSYTHSSKI